MHVDIDHHADLDSPVHRWDVRARLLSLFLLMFCIAFTRSLEAALVSLTLVVTLTLWARIPVRVMLRRVRWVHLPGALNPGEAAKVEARTVNQSC